MKFTKYIAASMIALAGLTSCGDSLFDTEYTQHLDESAAGEAAGKNPDVFLNGMWSWMVTHRHDGTRHQHGGCPLVPIRLSIGQPFRGLPPYQMPLDELLFDDR